MGVTSRANIPYPEAADPDMPRIDMTQIAEAADAAFVMFDSGPIAGRPVSTAPSPGVEGRFYYATDQRTLYYDYGTGWQAIEVRSQFNSLFPVDPEHGERYVIATDEAGNDPVWEFMWDTGISKWRKLGGEPLIKKGPYSPPTPYTSTNWATLPELTHRMPIPFPGTYRVKVSFSALATTVAQFVSISFAIQKTGADDNNYDSRAAIRWVGTQAASPETKVELEDVYTFASDVEQLIIAAHNGSAGNTVNVVSPRIELTPLALDG